MHDLQLDLLSWLSRCQEVSTPNANGEEIIGFRVQEER